MQARRMEIGREGLGVGGAESELRKYYKGNDIMGWTYFPIGKFDIAESVFDNACFEAGHAIASDGLVTSDTLIKSVVKALSEDINVSDTLIKSVVKALSEDINVSDTLIKSVVKALADSIKFISMLTTHWLSWAKVTGPTSAFTTQSSVSSTWNKISKVGANFPKGSECGNCVN